MKSIFLKNFYYIFIIICSTTLILAQPSVPSVNGIGYAKFVDFPISPFTGTFSYSVPIATVNSGSLSVPISIDYHSGGNRVGDPASNVGLGWNLNYGGSITRTIKGVDDNYPSKGYRYNPTPNTESCNALAVAEGNQDGEPDVYTWNAGGQGGKFFRNRNNQIVNITKTAAKIEMLFATGIDFGFFITLDNGIKYYFTPTSAQTKYPGSSWSHVEYGLQRITSFDDKDTISFLYSNDIAEFRMKYLAMPVKYGSSMSSLTTVNTDDTEYLCNERIINQIIGKNNKVTFTTSDRNDLIVHNTNKKAKRIDQIKFENGSYCFVNNLSYEYFKAVLNSNDALDFRLKLKSIQKIDCTNTLNEPPIVFDYFGTTLNDGSTQHFPSYLDKNIDHFGYYNKSSSENNYSYIDMIQPTYLFHNGNSFTVGNANRSPDFLSTQNSMLKKITLPTKGTIEYTYEQNDYSNGIIQNETPINLNLICGNNPISQAILVTNDLKTTGILSLSGTVINNNYCHNYNPKYVYLNIYNNSNALIYSDNVLGFNGTFSKTILLSNITAINVNESYSFELNTANCDGAVLLNYTNSGEYAAPGLRIKQIKTSDGINPTNDIIKTYNYRKFANSNQSSGFVVNMPRYGQAIQNSSSVVFNAFNVNTLSNVDGFGAGYENVTISYNGNGSEQLTFHKELTVNSGKYPQEPNQTLVGRSIDSKTNDSQGSLVSSSSSSFDESNDQSDFFHLAFKVANNWAVPNPYKLKTNRWVRVSSQTSNTDGVTTTNNHTYNITATPSILGPVESSMTNSDGKVSKTYIRYTSQYDPYATQAVNDIRNALIARNIIIPYEVRVEVDGVNFLSGSRTEFSLFHPNIGTTSNVTASTGIPRPLREMKYERTWNSSGVLQAGTWTEQKKFSEYGFKGKLTKYNDFGYSDNILEYDPTSYNVTKKSFIDHHTNYEYYPNSTLLKKVIDIDGTSVSYEYDALMRMFKTIDNSKQITKTYSYYFGDGTANDRHKTTVTTSFQGPSNAHSALTTIEDIAYYDNLGRTIQVVKKGQSPTNKDVITSMEYDKYGRVIKEYLPVEGTGSTGAYLPIVSSWKHSLTTYESTPLSRKLSVLPPDWHVTTYSYGSNTTANDGAITDPRSGYVYPQNTLYKTLITDPNGNKTIAFKDKKGRNILTAQYSGTTLAASNATQKKILQNVYDLKDRIEAVVVPGATWSTGLDLNYYYRYDGEDKLIYKKLPSRGDIHYIYNSKDLTAGWRDNNVGTSNWFSTLYDAYGRPVKTGFASTSSYNANSPNIISYYTLNTYGTTGIEKGKIKSAETQIIGTQQYVITNYVYNPISGRLQSTYGNHHLNIGNVTNALTSSYVYDQGGNVTNTNTEIIAASGHANLPINYIDKYDHIGRNTENIFQYNNGTQTTLSKQIYNHREELIVKYQGKTGLTGVNEYLQEMNFSYLTNGLLKSINQGYHTTTALDPNITNYTSCDNPNPNNYGTYNDKDLFYLELYYDQSIPSGQVPVRKNGEISAMRWQTKGRSFQNYLFTYDFLGQLKLANYRDYNHATNSMVNTGRFSEIIDYDIRGNITKLLRVGASSSTSCATNLTIDSLNYKYDGQTGNRVRSISDNVVWATGQNGFKPSVGSSYSYDANGNITADPYKGITSTIYNVFDKPTRINKSDGQYITFTYDGSGTILTKSIFNATNTLIEKRDYIGNFEYVNDVLESVMHSEGRYRSATAKHEYHFKDHLGNTRLVYSDANNDGIITVNTEILQESHYYPFGLEFKGHYIQQSGFDYRYKFNDIERLKDLDFGIDMAFYRGLDPTTGRWMQVDPKAEAAGFGMSPYCAMGNNPVLNVDPNGDLPFLALLAIGAATGVFSNGLSNVSNGQNFFAGAGEAALWGGVGAAVSFGVGTAFGAPGSPLHELLRAGAHAFTQGGLSAAQGGSFQQGAYSGGLGSLIGSSGVNPIIGGGVGGGFGSLMAGGNFWQGVGQGIAVGAFNHELHSAMNGPIEPPKDINGKYTLDGFPDAEYQGKSKGPGSRHVWKLKDGKFLEWTSKNGVVEMYDKSGKNWLGKFNPTTGKAISTTSKFGRVASFVGKGINFIGNRLSALSSMFIYVGPGSGFENYKQSNPTKI